MKFNAESNETTPAISFIRFHEDYEMFTKKDIKKVPGTAQIVEFEKKQGQTWEVRCNSSSCCPPLLPSATAKLKNKKMEKQGARTHKTKLFGPKDRRRY